MNNANIVKGTVLLILIFLFVSASMGQTPQTAQDYLKSAMGHFQSGNTDASMADVNKALELEPNYVDALYLRAALRNKKGDTPGVLADYNKIIELTPSAPGVEVVYTNRSMLRLQSKDVNGALDDLNKAVSINPRVAEIYNGRAIARLQKGDLDGALADYEKAIELKPSLPSAFLGRGYFRYQKEDFDGALADFSRAIELKPDYADAHVDRGMVRGLTGEIDRAIADIRKGVALNPRSISDSDRGNFSSPFIELNQFITRHPTNARAYAIRGVLRLLQRKETEAAADFKKSLELEPTLKTEINRITDELKPR
ncbi:MAG TPA: tetratricopeptide repeat protein [Pyrinomonadaceae bacterium]|nr:tetratricopeptide repeat protein [Pyrinomonadaceae bacterium]